MQTLAGKRIVYYAPVVLLFFIMAAAICQMADPLGILGYITAFFLLALLWKRPYQLTWLDGIVLILIIYEILNLLHSIDPLPGFDHLYRLLLCGSYYFCIRLSLIHPRKIRVFLSLCIAFNALMSLIALVSFHFFSSAVRLQAGFESLYDFKYLYQPLGNLTNVWGTILIACTGFTELALSFYPKNKKAIFFIALGWLPVAIGIFNSFSRGVYLAFLCLLCSLGIYFWLQKIKWSKKCCITFLMLGGLMAIFFTNPRSYVQTLHLNQTLSQQRSTEARLNGLSTAGQIIRSEPWMGVGSGNFSLAANASLYENDDQTYTHRAFNSVLQALTEKGIVGTLLWILLGGMTVYYFIREKEKSWRSVILIFTLCAILVREITFPVFFEHTGLQMMVLTLLALYQNTYGSKLPSLSVPCKTARAVAIIFTACMAVTAGQYGIHERDEKNNAFFLKALEADKLDSAIIYINRTHEQVPYLIHRSVAYQKKFCDTDSPVWLRLARKNLEKALRKNPRDMVLLNNLAIVLAQQQQMDSATGILQELVLRFPDNALYRHTLCRLLYQADARTEALPHMAKAIFLNPGLLETTWGISLREQDDTTGQHLTNLLREMLEPEKNDPIRLAKNGKLWLMLGDTLRSEENLRRASALLPNLSRPWYYLGIIAGSRGDSAQMRRYITRASVLYPVGLPPFLGSGQTKQEAVSEAEVLYGTYLRKFQKWYNSQTSERAFFSENGPD